MRVVVAVPRERPNACGVFGSSCHRVGSDDPGNWRVMNILGPERNILALLSGPRLLAATGLKRKSCRVILSPEPCRPISRRTWRKSHFCFECPKWPFLPFLDLFGPFLLWVSRKTFLGPKFSSRFCTKIARGGGTSPNLSLKCDNTPCQDVSLQALNFLNWEITIRAVVSHTSSRTKNLKKIWLFLCP